MVNGKGSEALGVALELWYLCGVLKQWGSIF